MASLNKVQIIGNLGKDPKIRHTQSGDKIASFSVACSEKWNDKQTGEQKEKTEWVNCSVFGKLADVIEKYVFKGSKIYVEGKFKTRKWQDASGNDKYSTYVDVQNMIMLDSKKESANNAQYKNPDVPDMDWDNGDSIPF
jgi:single-strand DNA-binding protein